LAKQERALLAWLNSHLSAYKAEFQEAGGGSAPTALTLQRMGAQVQGLLWRQYKKDQGLYETMLRVSAKIDNRIFNLTDVSVEQSTSINEFIAASTVACSPVKLSLHIPA
jgi:hypothetical protein